MEVAKRFFARVSFWEVRPFSDDILLLHPRESQTAGIAVLWQDGASQKTGDLATLLLDQRKKIDGKFQLYLVYKDQGPPSETVQTLRGKLGCETIPLFSPILEQALAVDECPRVLKELEEPYLIRTDPYAESKPINDPIWFYGREELLKRLPAVLAQGQHVGIFGLRKVGKTSLTNQLRQRFVATPTAFLDCQAFSPQATLYFAEILEQLHTALRAQGIRGLPRLHRLTGGDDFRQQLLTLFALWEKQGRRGPFLIILDEIDKFFPNREVKNSEEILTEYVRCFRVLRGLAQSRQCVVLLVVAYRPDVNRHNLLTAGIGENPMFGSFQEEHLGFLRPADSAALIREIGLWRQIVWDTHAAERVFRHCGGHPLITRYFASYACEEGVRKTIDVERVEETAQEIRSTLYKNEIGNYYKEGVWDLLREDEQRALSLICQRNNQGVPGAEMPRDLDEALTNLEHFGLVTGEQGTIRLSSQLFASWLQRRVGS